MKDKIKHDDIEDLANNLYASLLQMNLNPEEHKSTIDLLKKKGLSDDQIKKFLSDLK